MAASYMSILLWLPLMGGGTTDLLSFVPAQDYFKSREIEVSVDKMVELAGKGAEKDKTPVAQLLAIRWLGEHPAEAKKNKKVREILQQVADGKKGKDALGFAQDYAQRALAKLDGKPLSLPTQPSHSLQDALKWFPKECTIFGAVDVRPTKGEKITREDNPLRRLLTGMLRDREKEEMFKFVDRVGNVRIDRAAMAVVPDVNQENQTRIFMHFSGKGDPKRLADAFKELMGQAEIKEKKGPNGEKLTLLEPTGRGGPAMALVGTTDMLIAGYAGKEKHMEVLEEALKVMAGKKASILKGPHASALKTIKASGLAMGDLPEKWRGHLTGNRSPLKGVPKNFKVTLTRKTKGLDLRFSGSAATAKEAKAFVDSVEALIKEGIQGLKKLPPGLKIKPKSVEAMQAALKTIKLTATDALLSGRATLSHAALNGMAELLPAFFIGSPKSDYSEPKPLPPEPPVRKKG
jgi:hypothetical protein